MHTYKQSAFTQNICTIHPGEYHFSSDDIIIATVLGSCVSVAFWDQRLKQGGINHFMLPGDLDNPDLTKSQNAKYGMFAIELLYNDLLKAGSKKYDLVAKIFGGASVLKLETGPTKIPKGNVDFANTYLDNEGIPVVARDTGGLLPRKIFFFTQTGKVLLKRISGTSITEVGKDEEAYLTTIQKRDDGAAVLF